MINRAGTVTKTVVEVFAEVLGGQVAIVPGSGAKHRPREDSMIDSQPPLEPTDAFGQLGRLKLGEMDLNGVLDHLAHLAERTIPGADAVSVTLISGRDARTAAYTGELALILDEWQYGRGHGPCLDASACPATLSVPDMDTETRWPDLAARAVAAGVHSSLSIGLPLHEQITGALNVYGTATAAFDDEAVLLGQMFAGYAAVALANTHRYGTPVALARQMHAAMQNRAVIEQARGMIMADRHCHAAEAFAVLAQISEETDRELSDVAAGVVADAVATK
jgi:GAF domain-containing protein